MNYPFNKVSDDERVIQGVNPVDSKNFAVVHHINVDAFQKAVLGKVEIIEKEDDENVFINECKYYGSTPTSTTVLVKFIYDLLPDSRNYRLVMTFPENKEYYTIPGKPKAIAVATVNPPGGTTVQSKTGGEAL